MAREHDFFGVIAETEDGGLFWSDEVELGDQLVVVELTADDASEVSNDGLDACANLLRFLERFDARARDALVAQLSERASVTNSYIDRHMDEFGDDLLEMLVATSGDLAVDVLRSLQLTTVRLDPQAVDAGKLFATLVYSISPDDTDAVLTVGYDMSADVVSIETGEE